MPVVTRQKDPKKVEAGRRGAAAREAKMRERILAKLATEKEHLLNEPEALRPPKSRGHQQSQPEGAEAPYSPWLVAVSCLAVAGVAALVMTRSAAPASAAPPLLEPEPAGRYEPAPHLKGRDPFTM